ncbi:A24 family peptidase [Streptomyces sp. HNM0574]|uniref:A24 family peptidase n=1 Tax=Streptomyces sp. HNM0574 TaxID=2714954 RepID=UPI003216F1E1
MLLAPLLLVCAAAAYGIAAGALLPRPLYRFAVPPGEPARAACPQGHPLTGPGRGWLGPARCPRCPRPRAYGLGRGELLFPLVSGACCGGLAAATGWRPELAAWLLAVPVGLLLAAVDGWVRRLPDVLTLPLAGALATLLGVAALLPAAAGSWPRALLGGVVLGAVFCVLHLISPRGMAFGDVKLAPAVGVALGWYGWDALFAGAFLGFVLSFVWGVTMLVRGRLRRVAGRGTELPFGPFLLLGGFLAVLAGALSV